MHNCYFSRARHGFWGLISPRDLEVKNKHLPLTFVCIACVVVFDFYYPIVGRAFDLLSLVILLNWYICFNGLRLSRAVWISILFSTILSLNFFILGGEFRHFMGLILIVSFWGVFHDYFTRHREQCWYVLQIVAIAIALIFFLQILTFHLFNYRLDITGNVGSIPARIFNESTNYFRAASLYQEPNSYCVFAFIVATLMILQRRVDFLGQLTLWLMLVTMIMSSSLWGMALSVVLMLVGLWIRSISARSIFFMSLIAFLCISSPFWTHERTTNRLLTLMHDPTVSERYIGAKIEGAASESVDFSRSGSQNRWVNFLFGNGLHSRGFQQAFGANAWSYLRYNFGVVGLLLFVALVINFDKSKYYLGSVCVFLLCTSFPYFTYAIFPLFMVMLFDASETGPNAKGLA